MDFDHSQNEKTYFGDEQNSLKSNKGLKIKLNDFLKVLENKKSWIKQNFRHFLVFEAFPNYMYPLKCFERLKWAEKKVVSMRLVE